MSAYRRRMHDKEEKWGLVSCVAGNISHNICDAMHAKVQNYLIFLMLWKYKLTQATGYEPGAMYAMTPDLSPGLGSLDDTQFRKFEQELLHADAE